MSGWRSCIFLAMAFLLILPSNGYAQEAAYQYTPPPGWTKDYSTAIGMFVPPEGPSGGATIMLMPVQPLTGDLQQQTQVFLKGMEATLQLSDPQYLPPQRWQSPTGDNVAVSGTYKAKTGQLFLVLVVHAEKGASGALLFVANSQEAVTRYKDPLMAMSASLRLTDQAARLAAANVGGNTPNAAQPPAVAQPQIVTPSKPRDQSKQAPPPNTMLLSFYGGSLPLEGTTAPHVRGYDPLQSGATLQDFVGIWVSDSSFTERSAPESGGRALKIRADGSYEFYNRTIGMGCDSLKTQSGRVVIQPNSISLAPAKAHDRQSGGCNAYDQDVAPQPETFTYELHIYQTVFGYPTYRLRLKSPSNYFVLDRLDARPMPPAPPMTAYTPATGRAGGDLQGNWAAHKDEEPRNLDMTMPDDGKYHATLRLFGNGRYEMIVRRPNALLTPVCQKHFSLVEQGEAYFNGQMVNDRLEHGAMTLHPAQSHLVVDVTRCGPDDGHAEYNLAAAPRYLRWKLSTQNPVTAPPTAGDKLDVTCPQTGEITSTWAFLSCPESAGQIFGYTRR
jgi:hypothetical protein